MTPTRPSEAVSGGGVSVTRDIQAVKLRQLDDWFFGLWTIQETPCSSAVLSHHKRLLADALRVLGRG